MNRKRPNAFTHNAFTLVELLVTIGIIILLISILIPVVSRVRLAGQTAATQAQVQKISGAIQNYYNDFQAYPGAIPNMAFANNTAGSTTYFNTSPGPNYTQSEDLVMALLGASTASINAGVAKINYNTTYLGRGPVTYNPLNPEQKQPYMDFVREEITPRANGAYVALNDANLQDNQVAYATDSAAPEFMDRYSSSRPILYVRGNPGANSATSSGVYNSKSGGWQKTISYDCGVIQPYVKGPSTTSAVAPFDFPLPGSTTTYGWSGANLDPASAPVKNMFSGDAAGRARGNGTYLLISAGGDRIFGTSDDILFSGGGGQ